MIGTLDELKGKLDIPASDTSRDAALAVSLEAASAYVCERGGFSEADITGLVSILRNVRDGKSIYLPKRPVAAITTVEGRVPSASVDWTDLTGDLIDDTLGLMVVVSNTAGWRDPRYFDRPYTRGYRWPVLRVTYDVTGIGSDDNAASDVKDATLAVARYIFEQDLAGAADNVTVGMVTKHFREDALPAHAKERLAAFDRQRARWV